ncbi:hypothetical protein [Cellulophaga sp. L1A9]|uniref:hypothetical protein n=1 Tax=Cellulophaga sp. L1A9 TaxID=2686362 RepID=UPI00131D70B6|nr:hypothetical protein [Cellulophaga sp. L1A9]
MEVIKALIYLFLVFSLLSCKKEKKILISEKLELSSDKPNFVSNNLEADSVFGDKVIEKPFGFSDLEKGNINNDIQALDYFKKFISGLSFKEYMGTLKSYYTQEYYDDDLFYFPLKNKLHKLYFKDNILLKQGDISYSFIFTKKQSNNPNRNQENIFLVTLKGNEVISSKRIYSYFLGEFGLRNSRFFYINENNVLYIQDFKQEENIASISNIYKYEISEKGKFIRYYDKNGDYKNEIEEGLVKNNTREGPWVEKKRNTYVNDFTYLEAHFEDGKPVGEWSYFALKYKRNSEGQADLATATKSALLYTEMYKDGEMINREFKNE